MHLAQIMLWQSFCKNSPSIQNFQSRLIKSMQKTGWKVKLLERIVDLLINKTDISKYGHWKSVVYLTFVIKGEKSGTLTTASRRYFRINVIFFCYATTEFWQQYNFQFFLKNAEQRSKTETRISEAKSFPPLKYMRTSWEVQIESQLFLRKLLTQFVASHVLLPNLFKDTGGMSWNILHCQTNPSRTVTKI